MAPLRRPSSPRQVSGSGIGSSYALRGDGDHDELFFLFTTYTVPPEVHVLNVATGEERLWQRTPLPVDSNAYVVDEVFSRSKDGTRIPLFIVHAKSTPRDGRAPTILYGYGGFGDSNFPAYKPGIHAWLERGGIYAEACIRGGGDYGDQWHRDGMLTKKQNSFDDFISAAEELIQSKWTKPSSLAIEGEAAASAVERGSEFSRGCLSSCEPSGGECGRRARSRQGAHRSGADAHRRRKGL
jgi:prolyl oligopeptidase